MRHIIRLLLVVSLLVASIVFLTPAHAQPYFYRWSYAPSISCMDMGGFIRLTFIYPTEWDLPPGNVITQALIENGVESFASFSVPAGTGSQVNGPVVWDMLGTSYPVVGSLGFYTYVDGVLVYRSILSVSCSADTPAVMPTLINEEITSGGPGAGAGPGLVVVPVPGPDMVAIPDTAVVGTFTTSTPLYFQPEASSASTYSMRAGQSLWVFGLDESGEFYQVLLSGRIYWIPVDTMGPDFDAVWQGHPLPTNIVE